jgi:endogenous inhibitor of DNA gyrase (YacG/DUF329 family)
MRQTREQYENLERWYINVRKCEQCGVEFGSSSHRAKFCSDACKMIAYRRRVRGKPRLVIRGKQRRKFARLTLVSEYNHIE